jgi:hypothetical protein
VEDCQRACDLHKQALSSWNNASANAHGTCHRYRLEPCRRLVDKQFGHPAQNSHKSGLVTMPEWGRITILTVCSCRMCSKVVTYIIKCRFILYVY